ncbi:MAG: hypothetical protein ACJ8GO_17210 [Ramlibacter sp.]
MLQLLLPLTVLVLPVAPPLAAGDVAAGLGPALAAPPLLLGDVAAPPWATGADVVPAGVPELAEAPSPPLPPPQAASTAAAQEIWAKAIALRDADQAQACPLFM